jgi:trans-aconitate methyltransferase
MTELSDFEALYRRDNDPFGVASSWYECRKEQVLAASLTRSRYAFAWDSACGTGHLAHRLAGRCDRVLATDASSAAVGLTAALTEGLSHVECRVSALPEIPGAAREADLTVVAEVLYYLPDTARIASIEALARQRGELASVHWRHHPHDAHLSGADVTDELHRALTAGGWTRVVRHEDEDFVLAAWRRPEDG